MIIDKKEKNVKCRKNTRKSPGIYSGLSKLVKSDHIESYFVFKYDSGIYMVMFNTKERRIYYHKAADNVYMFANKFDKKEDDYVDYEIVEMKEFLPNSGSNFLRAHSQCKDQIYFYFIPFDLVKDDEF